MRFPSNYCTLQLQEGRPCTLRRPFQSSAAASTQSFASLALAKSLDATLGRTSGVVAAMEHTHVHKPRRALLEETLRFTGSREGMRQTPRETSSTRRPSSRCCMLRTLNFRISFVSEASPQWSAGKVALRYPFSRTCLNLLRCAYCHQGINPGGRAPAKSHFVTAPPGHQGKDNVQNLIAGSEPIEPILEDSHGVMGTGASAQGQFPPGACCRLGPGSHGASVHCWGEECCSCKGTSDASSAIYVSYHVEACDSPGAGLESLFAPVDGAARQ